MYTYVGVSTNEAVCLLVIGTMQTLPAVAVAMILVGLWIWTDLEIKRLQVRD
jgi:hypothetical protein